MAVVHVWERVKTFYTQNMFSPDPRTKDWFLLYNDPTCVLVIAAVYLVAVALLPKYMKTRQAFRIPTALIFIYNLGLVVLSLYVSIEMCLTLYSLKYNLLCEPYNEETRINPKELRMVSVLWWFFLSKVIELTDTILIRLRKKDSQASFLHVFHHTSMLMIWWWVLTYIPGGTSYFGCLVNSSVHVVMYTYYALATFPAMRRHLWWKKWITKLQLLQFVVVFIHSFNFLVTGCDVPLPGSLLITSYMPVMFSLFTNFYVKAYTRKDLLKQETLAKEKNMSAVQKSNGVVLHQRKILTREEITRNS